MKGNLSKYIVIILGIGVLAGIAIGLYLFNKPSATEVTGTADYNLEAKDLYAEFDENEEAANNKYLNKVLDVKGRISELGKPEESGFSLTLETDGMFGVSCEVSDTESYENLKIGDIVRIKGLCTGKLMDVVLVKCKINKSEN